MSQLLVKVLPLALASAISPASLAVSLVILGGKAHPRMKAFAYLVGGALVAAVLTGLGLLLAASAGSSGPHSHAVIDCALGSLLMILGLAALAMKPSQGGSAMERLDAEPARKQVMTCLLMGLGAMGLNVSSQVPFLAAVREVGRAPVNVEVKTVSLSVAWLFLLFPMILPLVIYIFAPKAAARILAPLSVVASKYGRYLVAVICLILGVVFVWDCVKAL